MSSNIVPNMFLKGMRSRNGPSMCSTWKIGARAIKWDICKNKIKLFDYLNRNLIKKLATYSHEKLTNFSRIPTVARVF